MKKLALLLFLFNGYFLEMRAQIDIGFSVGAGGCTINGKYDNGVNNKNALRGRQFMPIQLISQFTLKPKLYLHTGVEYANLGCTQNLVGTEDRFDTRYLAIPLKLRYDFNKGKVKVFVLGGFSIAQVISSKLSVRASDGSIDVEKLSIGNNPETDTFRNNDIWASLGVGLQLGAGFTLRLDLYNIGLMNIQPKGDKNNSMYNVFSYYSIGYIFRIKK